MIHNAGYYNGKIDEVAYWNTELSANAISALYNSGTPLSASSNSGNYTILETLSCIISLKKI